MHESDPICGLFLTCTESPFLSSTHNKYYKDITSVYHVQRWSLAHGGNPHPSGPLLEVNCLFAPCPPLAPVLAFPPTGHLFTYRLHGIVDIDLYGVVDCDLYGIVDCSLLYVV